MAKEYIEREALIEKLQKVEIGFRHCGVGIAPALASGVKGAIDKIKSFPTADVVEVVRCKDCACFIERTEEDDNDFPVGYGYCSHDKAVFAYLPPDHFCSYGERKGK